MSGRGDEREEVLAKVVTEAVKDFRARGGNIVIDSLTVSHPEGVHDHRMTSLETISILAT
jgi:hypothetical protein